MFKKVTTHKILLVLIILLSCMLLTGCHEEEQYNNAKNEFVKMEQNWNKLNLDQKEKHDSLSKELDAKLEKMEPLVKSKLELNNDFLALKEKYQKDGDAWNAAATKKQNDNAQIATTAGQSPVTTYVDKRITCSMGVSGHVFVSEHFAYLHVGQQLSFSCEGFSPKIIYSNDGILISKDGGYVAQNAGDTTILVTSTPNGNYVTGYSQWIKVHVVQ